MSLKSKGHKIKTVYPDSIAYHMDIEAGDVLLKINNNVINDVFDYRYYIQDEYIEVLIRKTNGEEWELEIEKDYDEDLGLEFDNSLMSEYKSCSNKCIFCFIDQMPPGMRDTLYFKDDDSRLSFLQGNYITLTNMKMEDVERIVKMHLAPINISVHTTNPELRCRMLNNRFAGEKLEFLKILYDNNIEMNGQIVLCKGVNDGAELERSIDDLSKYLPFMKSVSVVPAGITKYREGLQPLDLFNKEEAGRIIDLIEEKQSGFYEKYGLHFIHASDEWYINACRPFPEEDRYDGYMQLENGVGMMRLLINEVSEELDIIKNNRERILSEANLRKGTVTIATGELAYSTVKMLADKVSEMFPDIRVNVVSIVNDFFGHTITVTGLITAGDLIKQLKEFAVNNEIGDTLLIAASMLRTGEEVFLDDYTLEEVSSELAVRLVPVDSSGRDFVYSIIDCSYGMNRNNENEVYISYRT